MSTQGCHSPAIDSDETGDWPDYSSQDSLSLGLGIRIAIGIAAAGAAIGFGTGFIITPLLG
jgi:hypothetical protein